MPTFLRRFLLWTVICAVSAAPSYVIARDHYDEAAMVLGVLLFALGYTALTSTGWFSRFHARPFIRRTLYIGYGARLGLSAVMAVGALGVLMDLEFLMMPVFVDMFCGIISLGITQAITRPVVEMGLIAADGFIYTLVATFVQGTLLNAVVFIFMLFVYGIQRAFCRPPAEVTRGFEVLTAQPVDKLPA